MITCPVMLSHIATMRCGEYQRSRGCHCPNAATTQQLRRLTKIRDPVIEREPQKWTVDELAKEGFFQARAISHAISNGLLDSELLPTIQKNGRRRYVRIVSRQSWEAFKRRGASRSSPEVYSIKELSIKTKVPIKNIQQAIRRHDLYSEMRKVKIGHQNRVRRIHLITWKNWEEYRSKTKKVFSEEFKREAVRRVNGDRTIPLHKHAEELGISLSCLNKWKQQLKDKAPIDNSVVTGIEAPTKGDPTNREGETVCSVHIAEAV